MSNTVEGTWLAPGCSHTHTITNGHLFWGTGENHSLDISDDGSSLSLDTHTAVLRAGGNEILWSDGDVWTRTVEVRWVTDGTEVLEPREHYYHPFDTVNDTRDCERYSPPRAGPLPLMKMKP